MERAMFYRADADEYRSVPLPNGGSVFAIRRVTDGVTRRTRGWEIGTRVTGEYMPLVHPSSGAPLTCDTLREAKEDVRRMARVTYPASVALTYCGMRERGETWNTRVLMQTWLAGSDDVLAQFLPDASLSPQEAPGGAERSELTWYVYVPLHVAGSGGNRLVGKLRATEEEARAAFEHCARIEVQSLGLSGTIETFRRC